MHSFSGPIPSERTRWGFASRNKRAGDVRKPVQLRRSSRRRDHARSALKAGRLRDRVTATGTWRFVWQDGRELAFNGVALDREYDHEIDGYGITDGSAGMKGRVIASDDLQELKIMASAALSGFARGTQDRANTLLGNSVTGSVANGVREGAAEVFDMYAHRTLTEIEQNGYFVRVPAGKEFYVYVAESVDPGKARVAGV